MCRVENQLPSLFEQIELSAKLLNTISYMMMIAFITIKSSLVPLIEGLCEEIKTASIFLIKTCALLQFVVYSVKACSKCDFRPTHVLRGFSACVEFVEKWLVTAASEPRASCLVCYHACRLFIFIMLYCQYINGSVHTICSHVVWANRASSKAIRLFLVKK